MASGQISYIEESILENFQYADSLRASGYPVGRKRLSKIANLVETFEILAESDGTRDDVEAGRMYERKLKSLCVEHSFGRILEGFFNPFDDDIIVEPAVTPSEKHSEEKDTDDVKIRKVRVWKPVDRSNVVFHKGKVIAGKTFYPGDLIETCPVRLITGLEMYSEKIREFAFDVDPENGIYAIPFGLASYYRDSKGFNLKGNAGYEYEQMKGCQPVIKIVATRMIRKGSEVVLESDADEFENEVKAGQFDYSTPYVSVKNVRII